MTLVTIESSSDVTDTSCFDHFQRFVGRSINRTMLTVDGVMADELLNGTNKTGIFSRTTMALYLKRYHRESIKRLNMRKAVLRGDVVERQYGCGKCRWTPTGCGRCRAEGFVLGPKEGLTRVGIPRPGEEMSLVPVGVLGDDGGVKKKLLISSQTKICNNIYKKTKGKQRGHGIVAMEDIKKGEPILEFVGELLSSEQAMAREEYYEKAGMKCCYQMKLGSGNHVNVIDPTLYGNIARFANSSCNSNMLCKRLSQNVANSSKSGCRYIRPMFYAARDIKKGEELTWTYNNPKATGESSRTGAVAAVRRSSRKRQKIEQTDVGCSTNEFGGNIDEGEGYECFCGEPNCKSTL